MSAGRSGGDAGGEEAGLPRLRAAAPGHPGVLVLRRVQAAPQEGRRSAAEVMAESDAAFLATTSRGGSFRWPGVPAKPGGRK